MVASSTIVTCGPSCALPSKVPDTVSPLAAVKTKVPVASPFDKSTVSSIARAYRPKCVALPEPVIVSWQIGNWLQGSPYVPSSRPLKGTVASARLDRVGSLAAAAPLALASSDTSAGFPPVGPVSSRDSLHPIERIATKSLGEIGSQLRAPFIVEGSLRVDGPTLRIRYTLNRVADQVQVWSKSYDRDIASMASVSREMAAALIQQIHPPLPPQKMHLVSPRQSSDAAAYEAYLRGRRFWYQLTAATTRRAVDYYTRATDIDPQYALAWAGIAEALASAPINGDAEPLVMWPRARDAAQRAMEANSQLSESHTVAGQICWFFDWDWLRAADHHRQAIALDPSNAWSHTMLGHILSQLGRHDEGWRYMEQACTLEPMSALHHAMASQVAFQARDFQAARQRARRAIAIDPEFWSGT